MVKSLTYLNVVNESPGLGAPSDREILQVREGQLDGGNDRRPHYFL